jgi:hypothetical protein
VQEAIAARILRWLTSPHEFEWFTRKLKAWWFAEKIFEYYRLAKPGFGVKSNSDFASF